MRGRRQERAYVIQGSDDGRQHFRACNNAGSPAWIVTEVWHGGGERDERADQGSGEGTFLPRDPNSFPPFSRRGGVLFLAMYMRFLLRNRSCNIPLGLILS